MANSVPDLSGLQVEDVLSKDPDVCFVDEEPQFSRAAPNITVTDAYLIDGNFNRVTEPVIGEKVAVRIEWETTGLPLSVSYRAGFFVDGVQLTGGSTSAGAGVANGTGYNWYHIGWYATGNLQNVTVTIDVNETVTESDESDNTMDFSFQAVQPTDLPQQLILPIHDQLYQDVTLSNYHDVDPSSGIADYAGNDSSYNGHNAFDFGPIQFTNQDAGVELLAAADGTVVAINDGEFDRNTQWINGATANYVIVDHGNGYQTFYWHMRKDSVRVSVGDHVDQGDVLGYMGSSGISTGLHIHFGLNRHGRHVETMFDSAAYFVNPIANVFDQAYVTESVVTNHITSNHAKEGASRVSVFDQSPSQQVSVMGVFSGARQNDLMQFTWKRPDGSEYTTGSYNIPNDYSSSYWWFTRTLPNTPDLGIWTVDLKLNGVLLKQEFFEVTADGAPEMRIEDNANNLIVDDRFTPIEFSNGNLGGSTPLETFTVINHGSDDLVLSDIRVPDRFILAEGLDSVLAPGASDTFTVGLRTDVAGNHAGEISISTNDADELIYNFSVEGYVAGSGSQLVLGVSERRVDEGEVLVANVRRISGSSSNDLVVTLAGDATEVSMPATITIPAGQDYASFEIATLADGEADGPQSVELTASASGYGSSNNTLQVLDLDSAGPSIDLVAFDDGSGQFSMLNSISVDFDRLVAVEEGAFELRNADDEVVDVAFSTADIGGVTRATLSFSGDQVESNGSLEDGNYELTILGSMIRDFAGDAVVGDSVESFHRLFGDFDGNKTVNIFDLLPFRRTYLTSTGDADFNPAADYTADGTVNIFDLLPFRQRYLSSV